MGAGARASLFNRSQEEDRSRDWYCKGCGERNFMKRFECFKCKGPKPLDENVPVPAAAAVAPAPAPVPQPPRRLSPHAGSRAMREMYKARLLSQGGGAEEAAE